MENYYIYFIIIAASFAQMCISLAFIFLWRDEASQCNLLRSHILNLEESLEEADDELDHMEDHMNRLFRPLKEEPKSRKTTARKLVVKPAPRKK